MKNSFFVSLVTSILVSVLVSIGVFFLLDSKIKKAEDNLDKDLADVRNQIEETASTSELENEQSDEPETVAEPNYVNETYGFSLDFLESWDGFEVTTQNNPNGDTLCFYFAGQGQNFCILQVLIYNQEDAATISYLAEALLGESSDYIFVSDYDRAGECLQFNEFQCERSAEVPAILETFELLD